MWWILLTGILISVQGKTQIKDYLLTSSGDTINRVDKQGRKQGPWWHHYESLRGEPGYEEEGMYLDNRKEGQWRVYNLMGDLFVAIAQAYGQAHVEEALNLQRMANAMIEALIEVSSEPSTWLAIRPLGSSLPELMRRPVLKRSRANCKSF